MERNKAFVTFPPYNFFFIQSQYTKSLRLFSTTSTSFYFAIVKVAKVKSTSFCLVSAYWSEQNAKCKRLTVRWKEPPVFINVS